MVPILAYRLQEQEHGSLKPASRSRLRHLAKAFESHHGPAIAHAPILKPGIRLVRQWKDKVHLVNVETQGYEYHGIRYQSLSQIARLITGTRWSGPLFFGIKSEQVNPNSKDAK